MFVVTQFYRKIINCAAAKFLYVAVIAIQAATDADGMFPVFVRSDVVPVFFVIDNANAINAEHNELPKTNFIKVSD